MESVTVRHAMNTAAMSPHNGRTLMLRVLGHGAVALTAGALGLSVPQAWGQAIAYDTISNFTPPATVQFVASPWVVEDITLDPGTPLTLTNVDLLARLRSGATFPVFDGVLRLRVYTAEISTAIPAPGRPGTSLTELALPVSIARGTNQLVSFDLGTVSLPDSTFWLAWRFERSPGDVLWNDVWVTQSTLPSPVGSTSAVFGAGNTPETATIATFPSRYAVRVGVIPAPATALVLVPLGAFAARRRR